MLLRQCLPLPGPLQGRRVVPLEKGAFCQQAEGVCLGLNVGLLACLREQRSQLQLSLLWAIENLEFQSLDLLIHAAQYENKASPVADRRQIVKNAQFQTFQNAPRRYFPFWKENSGCARPLL